jgi:hypothetical protein
MMMSQLGEWKKPRTYILLGLVIFGASITYRYQDAIAVVKEKELQRELDLIRPPANASTLEHKSHHKAGSAYIETLYITSDGFDNGVNYYSSELQRTGWVFRDRRMLPLHFEQVEFCKGKFAAHLFREARSQEQFWFDVNWGLSNCGL